MNIKQLQKVMRREAAAAGMSVEQFQATMQRAFDAFALTAEAAHKCAEGLHEASRD